MLVAVKIFVLIMLVLLIVAALAFVLIPIILGKWGK